MRLPEAFANLAKMTKSTIKTTSVTTAFESFEPSRPFVLQSPPAEKDAWMRLVYSHSDVICVTGSANVSTAIRANRCHSSLLDDFSSPEVLIDEICISTLVVVGNVIACRQRICH